MIALLRSGTWCCLRASRCACAVARILSFLICRVAVFSWLRSLPCVARASRVRTTCAARPSRARAWQILMAWSKEDDNGAMTKLLDLNREQKYDLMAEKLNAITGLTVFRAVAGDVIHIKAGSPHMVVTLEPKVQLQMHTYPDDVIENHSSKQMRRTEHRREA